MCVRRRRIGRRRRRREENGKRQEARRKRERMRENERVCVGPSAEERGRQRGTNNKEGETLTHTTHSAPNKKALVGHVSMGG